jgi:NTP pyrophosphatase (non-canonical NTP hydrolase)
MRELFAAVDRLHDAGVPVNPATYYGEKVWREESGEFFETVTNEPLTPEQREHTMEEGTDVILCVAQAWKEMGITREEAEAGFKRKVEKIAGRPPEHFRRGIRGEGVQPTTDSLATGYFAPEAVRQREIAKVRESIRRETLDIQRNPSVSS